MDKKELTSKGVNVRNLQKFLNWYHPAWELKVDGELTKEEQDKLMIRLLDKGIEAEERELRIRREINKKLHPNAKHWEIYE